MARLAASRQPSGRQHPATEQRWAWLGLGLVLGLGLGLLTLTLALTRWATAARSRASSSVAAPALVRWVSPWVSPWVPSPCPCHVVREAIFSEAQYGGYRPMAFLMRAFFDAFRNRSALP